jgi:ferredoxin
MSISKNAMTWLGRKKKRYLNFNKESTVAYKINDDCVSCGTCAEECPVEAIKEGDGKYEIDQDTCTGCGTCASVCPTEAIVE